MDAQINDDSANHVYSDSDKASENLLQEDVISLTDRSVSRSSLPPEELGTLNTEEPTTAEAVMMPEAPTVEAPEDEWGFSPQKSQKSKKSKV